MQKGGGVKKTGIGTSGILPSGSKSGGGGQIPFLPKKNAHKNGVSSQTDTMNNPVLPSKPTQGKIK